MSEEKQQVEAIKLTFEQEFGRFSDLSLKNLNLSDAENLQRELGEFKTKHTGKKSELANSKKLIGRVAPEERGAFGQFVQSVEKEITTAIEETENLLKEFISDQKIEREQIERVRAVRARRDADKAENALQKLHEAATGTENLLPRILDCVENYVTVGEISHRLRKVWGEYREAVTV